MIAVNRVTTLCLPLVTSLISAHVLSRSLLNDWHGLDRSSWRSLPLQVPLVVLGLPLIFEPIDQVNERSQILLVEVEASRSDLDELFDHLLSWNISEHEMLLVLGQNGEPIWNTAFVGVLLIFQLLFEVFPLLSVGPLRRLGYFTHQTVARDNIPFDNFTQVVEVLIGNHETLADRSTWHLLKLSDVDVNKLLARELPSQGDCIL